MRGKAGKRASAKDVVLFGAKRANGWRDLRFYQDVFHFPITLIGLRRLKWSLTLE